MLVEGGGHTPALLTSNPGKYQEGCSSQSHPPPTPDDTTMNPTPTRALFLLLSFSSLAAAANFAQCLEDFKQDPSAVGGVDFRGQPVSPAEAVGLTYQTCTARCGTDSEPFNWRTFALLFVTWLLPWLALLSQLPFGSDRVNDFVSG